MGNGEMENGKMGNSEVDRHHSEVHYSEKFSRDKCDSRLGLGLDSDFVVAVVHFGIVK